MKTNQMQKWKKGRGRSDYAGPMIPKMKNSNRERERESATTEFPCSKNIHVVEPYTLLLLLDVPRFRGEKTPLAFK